MDQEHLEVAVAAARAGAVQLMARRDSRVISEKASKDLVTDADIAAQRAIREVLERSFPGYAFVGEEQGENDPPASVRDNDPGAPPCWIVDPLDGTVNFIHRLQNFAVSIGLYAAGKMRLGVIYDPVYQELFTAIDGGPAMCNGRVMRVSGCRQLESALVACSFPPAIKRDSPEISRFISVLQACQSLRRLGSCALNMCYVADGRLDAYWATSVFSWDSAAGIVICRQAGATLSGYDGGALDDWVPRFCVSASKELHGELTQLLASQ